MNADDRPSPLPGDIRALIDADLRSPGMSSDAQQRVLRRIGSGLVAAGIATTIVTASSVGTAAGAASGGGIGGVISGFFARKATLVAAAFLLGGATGVSGYAVGARVVEARHAAAVASTAQTAPTASIDNTKTVTAGALATSNANEAITIPDAIPSASAIEPPLDAPLLVAIPVATVATAPLLNTTMAQASASAGRDVDLASERALVEMARSALSHGNYAQALDAVARHAAKFPYGQLVEERESIAVHALADAGRIDEARLRASRFRKRFPMSIFLPSIDAAVGSAAP